MTVYEQIQTAIDYIEENLFENMTCRKVAQQANMSLRSFYNYFWALTGCHYGAYVRRRRLSEAADKLQSGKLSITDIALEHGYESLEAFSRAFKEEFGDSPRCFRLNRCRTKRFGAINIHKERILGIIIKELPPMQAISCQSSGPGAEGKTHDRIWTWARGNGIGDLYGEGNIKPYRLFGHNLPDLPGAYKLSLVVPDLSPDSFKPADGLKLETFDGGRFAVLGVEGDIGKGWQFIHEGWQSLAAAVKAAGHMEKEAGRCFEEKLEPCTAGHLRLDLYLEIS